MERGYPVVYILMEYADDGTVFDLMESMEKSGGRRFSENDVLYIFKCACQGTKALHDLNPPIAHCDLKIENILKKENKFM